MNDPLEQALRALGGRLLDVLLRDADLRQSLRDVAHALLNEEAAPATPAAAPAQAPPPEPPRLPDLSGALEKLSAHYGAGGAHDLGTPEAAAGAVAAKLAQADEPIGDGPVPALLEEIARVARVKSEAVAALLATADDTPDAAAARAEAQRDLAEKSRGMPDGDLWMLRVQGPLPAQFEAWTHVGDAFAEVAEAAVWLRLAVTADPYDKERVREALHRAAAAQSALRAACQRVGETAEPTQLRAFGWLREYAHERRFFIERHMREQDKADPKRSAERAERTRADREALEEARDRLKGRGKRLNKIKYHANQIAKARGADTLADWRTISTAVTELVADGMPPSNKDLRELLLPIVDAMPDALEDSPQFNLALREMDRYLALSRVETTVDEAPIPAANAEIEQTRRLLEGLPIVLIGGDSRPAAKAALEESFGLSELIWLSSRPHQSIADFKPYIQRDDVALVLLAIRWSSHSFGDVKDFCDEVGKPLVRLPAGYHPNQVARQIIEQASQRLAA